MTIKEHQRISCEKWLKSGREVTSWLCPYCSEYNPTITPHKELLTKSKPYVDSAMMCGSCEGIVFVKTWETGLTKVWKLEPGESKETPIT